MKKAVLVAAILTLIAAVLLYALWPRKTREQLVCEKLVTLCSIEQISATTCTDGLLQTKRRLGDEALTAAEDCVLRAESCAGASVCLADKGLRALAPFVEALLAQSVGSAKQLASRLVAELRQRSKNLGAEAKAAVGKLSRQLAGPKEQVAGALKQAGAGIDQGKEALAQKAKQATAAVTAAQREVRAQIAAEIAAAEAKVEAAHADARQWVGDAIDAVGQKANSVGQVVSEKAKRVGDVVAKQWRRGLGALRGDEADAAAAAGVKADAAAPAPAAAQDPVKAIEEQLARIKERIAAERYDEARTLLGALRWPAGVTGDGQRDRQLAAYYRAKQQALLKIVQRRQAGAAQQQR